MFGYVKPYTPELKIIENQYYKATYCGLCDSMKRECGRISTFALSYDITFLVLIRLAVSEEIPEFHKRRCMVHPLKKRLSMKPNNALKFSANMSAILAWNKIKDDIYDEKGINRISAYLKGMFLRSAYHRARKKFPALDDIIKTKLSELSDIERSKVRSADRPAAVFGQLMADILSYDEQDREKKLILSAVGDSVGRWIYLIDAIDDIEDDRKKNSYNPFLLLFDMAELDREKKLDIESALLKLLQKAKAALDLVPFDDRRDLEGLVNNIICLGLPQTGKKLLFGNTECEKLKIK
ncbi:MAG: DUF5685 family protein [Clostridia bacterium]|nr:DUF5685 family protein [Clostridia bacterium]